MLLTQSLLEYGALDSLAESVIRLCARGHAWFDEWGDTVLVIGAICVAGWVVLRVLTGRRR